MTGPTVLRGKGKRGAQAQTGENVTPAPANRADLVKSYGQKSSKLSIAVLTKKRPLLAWEKALVSEVAALDYAEFVLWIELRAAVKPDFKTRLDTVISNRLARRGRPIRPEADAFSTSAGSFLRSTAARIPLPDSSKPTDNQRLQDALRAIRDRAPDLIIALDSDPALLQLASIPDFGLWYFCHGEGSRSTFAHEEHAGLREVLRRRPTVRTSLIIEAGGHQPRRWSYSTYSGVNSRSYGSTRNEHFWKLSRVLPRVLRGVVSFGFDEFLGAAATSEVHDNFEASPGRQTGSAFGRFWEWIGYEWWRIRESLIRRFTTERWILMISRDGNPYDLENFQKIIPDEGRFWADPCLVSDGCNCYVFFEEASLETGKGHISVMQIHQDGSCTTPRIVVQKDFHLSYPYLFRYQEELYMIPESAENRTVDLYRCRKFPDEWEFVRSLMVDFSAYDVTLFEHNDVWWLFANVKASDEASSWDEMHIYYNSSPKSDRWLAHPRNPVISDVRRARPAGRIFVEDGRIIRPSQDSSYRYGYRLALNEVVKLDKTTYRERHIRYIEPGRDRSIKAVHTFSQCRGFTMIDAMHRVSRFAGVSRAGVRAFGPE